MSVNGELKQISDQYRDYVFCEACEAALNHGGERWVIRQVPRTYGGRFPFREMLTRHSASQIGNGIARFNISSHGEKLLYFGFSIFWRAAVHKWTTTAGGTAEKIVLGKHLEPMRQFILGSGALPTKDIVLSLDVWPEVLVLPALLPVVSEQHDGYDRFWFYIPGFVFMLWLGKSIPAHANASNLAEGSVTLEVGLAISVRKYFAGALQSQKLGPKIPDMMRQIDDIRSKKPSKPG